MARCNLRLDQRVSSGPRLDARRVGLSVRLRSGLHQHAGAGTQKSVGPGPYQSLPSMRGAAFGILRRSREASGACSRRRQREWLHLTQGIAAFIVHEEKFSGERAKGEALNGSPKKQFDSTAPPSPLT